MVTRVVSKIVAPRMSAGASQVASEGSVVQGSLRASVAIRSRGTCAAIAHEKFAAPLCTMLFLKCRRGYFRPRRTPFSTPELVAQAALERAFDTKHERRCHERLAEKRRTHRAIVHRLRRRDRGVGIAHLRAMIVPPLMTQSGFTLRKGGRPQQRGRRVSLLHRADMLRHAMRESPGLMVYLAT